MLMLTPQNLDCAAQSILNAALSQAIGDDQAPKVRALLAQGANPNALVGDEDSSRSMLRKAIALGHHDSVTALLEGRADVQRPSGYGEPPLHLAAKMSEPELCELLIMFGAQVNAPDRYGHTALNVVGRSARNNHIDCARTTQTLLRLGADASLRAKSGETALHLAVHEQRMKCVQQLIDAGCPLDLPDSEGATPVVLAGRLPFAKKRQVFMLALRAGGLCESLLPPAARRFGMAEAAAAIGWDTRVIELLEQGEPERRSPRHRSVSQWADISGHAQTAQLVRAWSARQAMRSLCAPASKDHAQPMPC